MKVNGYSEEERSQHELRAEMDRRLAWNSAAERHNVYHIRLYRVGACQHCFALHTLGVGLEHGLAVPRVALYTDIQARPTAYMSPDEIARTSGDRKAPFLSLEPVPAGVAEQAGRLAEADGIRQAWKVHAANA